MADDLDEAYRRALAANEAAEWQLQLTDQTPYDSSQPTWPDGHGFAKWEAKTAGGLNGTGTGETVDSGRPRASSGDSRVSPGQVLEAAIFVGGGPLTTKKLCWLLGSDFSLEFVEESIERLNARYVQEGRPYTVSLGEGGYRMTLLPKFERLRRRVYGLGPKEIRLSQEALDVLALVAYKQPVTRNEVENYGKNNAGSVLRQLVRRELIAVKRREQGEEVEYETTPRFLSLFGLGSLDELPQADDLSFK